MAERPILFSAPMVRAILEGRKTQTRRVVKLPHMNPLGQWEPTTFCGTDAKGVEHEEQAAIWHTRTGDTLACPYGQPGDRLWVRETFAACGDEIRFRADQHHPDDYPGAHFQPWKPSIHMPRSASRILLEITDVRVERLQSIRNTDALAEGVDQSEAMIGNDDLAVFTVMENAPWKWANPVFRMPAYVARFILLWDSINDVPPKNWNSNPWVWVVKFKRVEAT